ncbi:MAG TPA: cupin domain-containing protein [Gemmatimonadales bacterium]|nr:cupin domain-containing protein [Gemmatimonadales bacterium]
MAEAHGSFVEPDGGVTVVNPLGGSMVFKLRGEETNGRMTALVAVNAPGAGPPLHTHANEDEIMLVTQGAFRFQIGDERREGGVGSVAYIPRGLPHTWQVIGQEAGTMFIVFAPAGMDRFFERMSEYAGDPAVLEAFRRIGSETGMEVVGAPLD